VTRTCIEYSEVAPSAFASLLIILVSQYPMLLLASLLAEVKFALLLEVLAYLAYLQVASPLLLIRQLSRITNDMLLGAIATSTGLWVIRITVTVSYLVITA
jgi:hypothetical protein